VVTETEEYPFFFGINYTIQERKINRIRPRRLNFIRNRCQFRREFLMLSLKESDNLSDQYDKNIFI